MIELTNKIKRLGHANKFRRYNQTYDSSGIVEALDTSTGGGHQPCIAQALQTDGQLRQGTSWGTNTPQSGRNIRRLTPIECERLQGFPDNWTFGLSDTQRYKCMGNAVTVNVVETIGRKMLEVDLFGTKAL